MDDNIVVLVILVALIIFCFAIRRLEKVKKIDEETAKFILGLGVLLIIIVGFVTVSIYYEEKPNPYKPLSFNHKVNVLVTVEISDSTNYKQTSELKLTSEDFNKNDLSETSDALVDLVHTMLVEKSALDMKVKDSILNFEKKSKKYRELNCKPFVDPSGTWWACPME